MIDPTAITEGMPVIGSDGETLGQVDEVEAAGDAVRRTFADAGFTEPDLFTAAPSRGAHPVVG